MSIVHCPNLQCENSMHCFLNLLVISVPIYTETEENRGSLLKPWKLKNSSELLVMARPLFASMQFSDLEGNIKQNNLKRPETTDYLWFFLIQQTLFCSQSFTLNFPPNSNCHCILTMKFQLIYCDGLEIKLFQSWCNDFE